jgi:hypothetical protein
MPDKEEKISFLPFHAINEFMRPDYRDKVIHLVFENWEQIPENLQKSLDNATKKSIQIPGFRNSAKAPIVLKIKNAKSAFEKSPQLVALVLSAWATLNSKLRQQVFDILQDHHWKLLPTDTDRTILPGFMTVWPEGETFDHLYEAYQQAYPESQMDSDDVSLMVVWLSNRLPYQFDKDLFKIEDVDTE